MVFVPKNAVFSEQTCHFEVFVPVSGLFSEQILHPPRIKRRRPIGECYLNDPSKVKPEDLLTEIQIPVE